MHQASHTFAIETSGRGLYEITAEVARWIDATGLREGLLTLLVQHTSASIAIQENAAPQVRQDILAWLERLAPEDADYAHASEGPDDMPAHLRALLTGVTLSIPVLHGRMSLGTWQGIYLCEHRTASQSRSIAAHLIGV